MVFFRVERPIAAVGLVARADRSRGARTSASSRSSRYARTAVGRQSLRRSAYFWSRRVLGELPLRSWMSVRADRSALILAGRESTVGTLLTLNRAQSRRAKQQIEAMLPTSPTVALADGELNAIVDLRDVRESTARACLWLTIVVVAAGWRTSVFLLAAFCSVYPVVSGARLLTERLIDRRRFHPVRDHSRREGL